MMGKLIILWVLCLVAAALAQDESRIIFNTDEVLVNINEMVSLDCGFQGTYRYCVWEHAGELFDVVDIHNNIYSGLSKPENVEGNQCGIVLDSVAAEDHGEWTCKVYIKGNIVVGSKNDVTILVKPPQAKITPTEVTVKAGEEKLIKCIVMEARPAVQLRWFLDQEDITEYSQVKDIPISSDGVFLTVSTLHRTFTPVDNEKELTCVVDHPSLEEANIVPIPVDIMYAPMPDIPQTFYVNETDFYEIRVNFSANPKPTRVLWQYGNIFDNITDKVDIPIDDENILMILTNEVTGHFTALLNISRLNVSDFPVIYNLFVDNEIGNATYEVILEAVHVYQKHDKCVMTAVAVLGTIIIVVSLIIVVRKLCTAYKVFICCSTSVEPNSDAEKGAKQPYVQQTTSVMNGEMGKEDENGNKDTV